MKIKSALLLCLLSAGLAAVCAAPDAAAEVYKWVDAAGTTHFSDTPPPQAKGAAKVEVRGEDASWPNRHAARVRAADEQVRLHQQTAGAAPRDTDYPPVAMGAAATMRPFNAPPDTTREQRMAAFRKSQECFGPFTNVNGSVRPEAFVYCTEMKEPSREP